MKLAKKWMDRIQHLDDERAEGNGWMVTLKRGWCIDPIGKCHVFGEDTLREVASTMAQTQPCRCDECETYLAMSKQIAKDSGRAYL